MLQPLSSPPEPLHATTKPNTTHENSTSTHATLTKSTLSQVEATDNQLVKFNVPLVSLNSDKISVPMAARLAVSLLCHVLFLKSQIPL